MLQQNLFRPPDAPKAERRPNKKDYEPRNRIKTRWENNWHLFQGLRSKLSFRYHIHTSLLAVAVSEEWLWKIIDKDNGARSDSSWHDLLDWCANETVQKRRWMRGDCYRTLLAQCGFDNVTINDWSFHTANLEELNKQEKKLRDKRRKLMADGVIKEIQEI